MGYLVRDKGLKAETLTGMKRSYEHVSYETDEIKPNKNSKNECKNSTYDHTFDKTLQTTDKISSTTATKNMIKDSLLNSSVSHRIISAKDDLKSSNFLSLQKNENSFFSYKLLSEIEKPLS